MAGVAAGADLITPNLITPDLITPDLITPDLITPWRLHSRRS
jgi:hypothetical protein